MSVKKRLLSHTEMPRLLQGCDKFGFETGVWLLQGCYNLVTSLLGCDNLGFETVTILDLQGGYKEMMYDVMAML